MKIYIYEEASEVSTGKLWSAYRKPYQAGEVNGLICTSYESAEACERKAVDCLRGPTLVREVEV